jgi:hypothetical protein
MRRNYRGKRLADKRGIMMVWIQKKIPHSFFICNTNGHRFKVPRLERNNVKYCLYCGTTDIKRVKWKKSDL